jgi:hypothetical protein
MKITKLPNGEYYLQKGGLKRDMSNTFEFVGRANNREYGGKILLSAYAELPNELVGKKLMFKVKVMEDE